MTIGLLAVGDMHLGRRPSRLPEAIAGDGQHYGPAEAWKRIVDRDVLEKADDITANTINRVSDKADERRQRVLIRLSGAEKPESIHDHVDWLENALPGKLSTSDKLTEPEQDHDIE